MRAGLNATTIGDPRFVSGRTELGHRLSQVSDVFLVPVESPKVQLETSADDSLQFRNRMTISYLRKQPNPNYQRTQIKRSDSTSAASFRVLRNTNRPFLCAREDCQNGNATIGPRITPINVTEKRKEPRIYEPTRMTVSINPFFIQVIRVIRGLVPWCGRRLLGCSWLSLRGHLIEESLRHTINLRWRSFLLGSHFHVIQRRFNSPGAAAFEEV